MGKGGSVPNLEDPAETKIDSYKVLGERFQMVWDLLEQSNTTTLAFFCKSGRHRSYGLMIAFLMWASHIHDLDLWANLIAEIRDPVLQGKSMKACELVSAEDLRPGQKAKGYVPFAPILMEFAKYLNTVCPEHAWPFKRP